MADTNQTARTSDEVSTTEVTQVTEASWVRRCFDSQPLWLWIALGALALFGVVGLITAPDNSAETASGDGANASADDQDGDEVDVGDQPEEAAGEAAAGEIVASASPAPVAEVAETTPVTVAPATTSPARSVSAEGRQESCRYGSDCLIVGFTISGFSATPSEFTCEFSDGSRYTFSLSGPSVETACMTADRPDSITIEVDGVRSETMTSG